MSLEDELLQVHGHGIGRRLVERLGAANPPAARWLGRRLIRRAQRAAERAHSRARRQLLRFDEHLETALAFSGRGE